VLSWISNLFLAILLRKTFVPVVIIMRKCVVMWTLLLALLLR